MKNEFELAFNEIAEVRTLAPEVVLEALQTALISAYRRDANASAAQRVEASIDPSNGRAKIFVEKEVVDDVMNPNTEVTLESARYYDPEANYGDMVMVQVQGTTKNFGRIAAQTAKQVILQKIREAERNALYEEYVAKEGEILNGQVQSVNSNFATLTLNNRAEAILPRVQQIQGERYKPNDKLRVYVMEVKRTNRGPQIVVSRSHRNMLRRLLEFEVPEIYNGQVEIKNIAREAGGRSKVAVAALQDGIDPVGACVGMRGVRIQNIVKELHDEKIDVIEWSPNQEDFIKKALSPARVTGVYLDDDPDAGRTAVVIVPDDQLSLAIGREGQNARLAAKLTGWRIDIKSVAEAVSSALAQIESPALTEIRTKRAEVVEEAQRIITRKNAGMVIQPEEYTTMGKFADTVERRLLAARMETRQARLAEINAVKATLPAQAFAIPVTRLDLPDNLIEALQPLETAGEIMLRFLIDESRLRRLLSAQSDNALLLVQQALDKLVLPELFGEPEIAEVDVAVEDQAVALAKPVTAVPEAVADETVLAEELVEIDTPAKEIRKRRVAEEAVVEVVDLDIDDDELVDKDTGKPSNKKKKERQQRRQFVFDEDMGEVRVKHRRKGGRKQGSWDEPE
ncbi:MAG: transcription termination/antitermination protein NusA [Anaerolineae bacterium]|nr:transcription termination/antitermination protein NusA [Anaerolineae bacterium]